ISGIPPAPHRVSSPHHKTPPRLPNGRQRGSVTARRETMRAGPALAISACVGLAAALPRAAVADADSAAPTTNPATVQEAPQVVVIGNAPLPGFGLPLNQIPSNVQTADSQDVHAARVTDVATYLNQHFNGVSVNESADNPYQLDINYHGFTASPLIGT